MADLGMLPIRATGDEIDDISIADGQIIFETDNDGENAIFLDTDTYRIIVGGKTPVIDNLVSTDIDKALSANMGKVMNEILTESIDELSFVQPLSDYYRLF